MFKEEEKKNNKRVKINVYRKMSTTSYTTSPMFCLQLQQQQTTQQQQHIECNIMRA